MEGQIITTDRVYEIVDAKYDDKGEVKNITPIKAFYNEDDVWFYYIDTIKADPRVFGNVSVMVYSVENMAGDRMPEPKWVMDMLGGLN